MLTLLNFLIFLIYFQILLLSPIETLSAKSLRIARNLTNNYEYHAFNPGNPFIYEVPEAVEFVLSNKNLNHSTVQLLNPYQDEKRIIIGDYHYYKIKNCGIHFLNPGEGFILSDEMFSTIYGSERCSWAFVGSQFCTPSIDFVKFKDKKSNCRTNYLQISDAGESFSFHFCNSTMRPTVKKEYTSIGGLLDVNFRFSQKYKKPEFEAKVKCVPFKVNFTTIKNKENKTEVVIIPPVSPHGLIEKLPAIKLNQNCKCGMSRPFVHKVKRNQTRTPRVLGGRITLPHEYPFMVGLMNPGRSTPFCGASLISDRYLLTAAHCVEDEEIHDLIVILKEHDFENDTETNGRPIRRRFSQIIPYPYYLESTFFGDVALLLLDRPVDTRDLTLSPICLPDIYNGHILKTKPKTYVGQDVIGAGWGTEFEGGPKSPKLRDVQLKVFSNEACNDYHNSVPPEPSQVMDNMLCSGYPEGGRDTCSGDSGGPLFFKERNQRFTQIGITSWGFGCGVKSNPGVFSRVTSFLYWIRMHTVDSVSCI